MNTQAFTSVQASQGLPWVTALSVAVATSLWLALGPAPEILVFDRAAIAGGEAWRLVTGHLVHCDSNHALWDIVALALIGWLMEGQGHRRMVLAMGVGILTVDAGLWWATPELERYCGLSGMLNTLFVVGLADLWRRHRHPVFPLAGLLLGVKLSIEMVAGQAVLVDTLWPAVPLVHIAGCLGGLVLLVLTPPTHSNHPGTGEKQ